MIHDDMRNFSPLIHNHHLCFYYNDLINTYRASHLFIYFQTHLILVDSHMNYSFIKVSAHSTGTERRHTKLFSSLVC